MFITCTRVSQKLLRHEIYIINFKSVFLNSFIAISYLPEEIIISTPCRWLTLPWLVKLVPCSLRIHGKGHLDVGEFEIEACD